jgi:hypothetical protein
VSGLRTRLELDGWPYAAWDCLHSLSELSASERWRPAWPASVR